MKVPSLSRFVSMFKGDAPVASAQSNTGLISSWLRVKRHLPNAASRRFKSVLSQALPTAKPTPQEIQRAQQALKSLDERSQLAFEMFVLGGYNLAEVAMHLALRAPDVQQLLETALTALGTALPSSTPYSPERHAYALRWLVELSNDASQSKRVQDFEQWLALSAHNQAAFTRACRLWQLALAQTPRLLYVKSKTLFTYGRLLACVLLGVIACLAWVISNAIPQGSAQIRSLMLEDASAIQLAPHTEHRFIHTPEALTLELERGAAYVETAFGRDKPLMVKAHALTIEGHQAAFEVSEHASELTVSVGRGHVQIQLPDQRPSQVLIAGQKLRFDHATERFIVQPYPIEHIALWREGLILIDQERLDRVLERFDRSLPGWSFIQDRSLAETHASALIRTPHAQPSLHALLEPWGAQVEHYGPWLRVIKRPNP